MGCGTCPEKMKASKAVEEEIKEIQRLLAEAHIRTQVLSNNLECGKCLKRISFLIEGLEILSKMNVFADAYRATVAKWREWIARMAQDEDEQRGGQPAQ